MKLKRYLSFLLSFTMIFSLLQTPSFAGAGLVGSEKAKIEFVYLTEDANSADGSGYSITDPEELNVGDTFFIGVKTVNFSNIKEVADAHLGLTNLAVGLAYDPQYLKLEPHNRLANGNLTGSKLQTAIKNRLTYTNSILQEDINGYSYEVGASSKDSSSYPDGSNAGKAVLYTDITSNSIGDGMLPSYKGERDLYISIVEFEVLEVPESGAEVFSLSEGDMDTVLKFGFTGENAETGEQEEEGLYQLETDDSSPTNIHTVLAFDFSKANIFPATYTVTYNANTDNYSDAGFKDGVDESTEAIESVKEGSKATLKNANGTEISSLLKDVPSKVFEGWYENADPTNKGKKIDPATDDSIITADTTVYAHYADGYKVTFNLNADDAKFADNTTAQKSIMAAAGEKLLPDGVTLESKIGANPTRTGYTFEGWYTKSNDSFVQKYEENDLNAVLPASIDLYARWSDDDDANKDYRIIFDKNNGDTDADPTSVGYNDGDTLQKLIGGLPVEPTKANYKFLGWYKNASGDGERLEADTVLNNYITNGTKDPGTTVYARWGDVTDVKPPVPSSTAVTVHFAKDAEGKYDGGTYDYDTVNDKYIKYGDTLGPIPDGTTMKKDGKAFDGWYTQETGGVKVESTTTIDNTLDANSGLAAGGTVTLYPRWMDKVTVTYDANGLPAKYTMPDSVEGVPNEDFTVGNIDFGTDTYELVKWNTEADGTGTDYTPDDATAKIPASSTTLYAIWNYTGDDKVTVIFNGNDTDIKKAELTPNDDMANNDVDKKRVYTITRKPNDTITAAQMPSAARTDYTFNHWNISATAAAKSEPVTQDSITVTTQTNNDPMNIYAIWTVDPSATEITISFDVDGATNPTSIADVKIAEGDALGSQMPADPEKDGFEFGGWYIQPDNTVEADNTTTFNVTTTLKAHWTENVTVKYNVNGADTPASIDDVTKAASEIYVDPTPVPTKTGYKFIGWNTKKSGGGTYIAADGTMTYAQVAAKLEDDKTLYAQWADVPDGTEPDVKDDNPVNPNDGAVHVTFDDNVPATTVTQIITPTNPKNKYPKLNGTLDDVSMPDHPDRGEKYTFEGWNTKPDGSGKTITGTTVVNNDEGNFNGAIKPITGETDKYEVTLYAQWEAVPEKLDEPVTLTFYNSTPDGKKGAEFKTITVEKGEVLGYEVTGPTNDIAEFFAWAEGTVDGNNQITFDRDGEALRTFNPNDSITVDKTYYANWTTYVALYLQGYDPDSTENTVDKLTYTGQAHNPKYDLRYIKYDDDTHQAYHPVGDVIEADIDPFNSSIVTVNYQKEGTTVTEIKDVGTYTIDQDTLELKAGTIYANAGMSLVGAKPSSLIVKEAGLTLKVRAGEQTDGQKQKKGQNTLTAIELTGMLNGESTADLCDVEYYKIKDDTAATISGDSDLTLVTETDPTKWDIGKYVIKVKPKSNSNYKITSVVADDQGGAVLFYEREQQGDYPGYPSMYKENPSGSGTYELTVMGQNIVYELVASDPEIANITLTGNTKYEPTPGATPEPTTKPLELKDSDYTASKPIQTTPNPDPSANPDWDKHYVRVDKYNESIDFEITAKYPDTTTVTATYGKTGETTTTPATVTQDPVTKEWTVNIPTNIKAPDTTTVTVTMTSGGETREYTFVLQALIAGKIELNYGNSPYGEIMKMGQLDTDAWDEAKITAAKENFDIGNKFVNGYIPTGGDTKMFSPKAWGNSTDSSVNLDRNDYAIFIYNKKAFKDPGFTATDALGNAVSDTDITRTMEFKRMSANSTAGMKDANVTDETATIVNKANDAVIDEITSPTQTKGIRPGAYKMEYSFTDPVTNENVTIERDVVVVWDIGDSDLSTIRNAADSSAITSHVKGVSNAIKDVNTASANVFLYRIMDVDRSGIVNAADASGNTSIIKGVSKPNPFYMELK